MSAYRGTRSLPSGRSFEDQKKAARGRLFKAKRGQFSVKNEPSDPCFSPATRSSAHASQVSSKRGKSNSAEKNELRSIQSSRDKMLEEYQSDDSLLKVQVDSNRSKFVFYVPVSILVEREKSMRETALQYGIGDDRWISSMLYREWKKVADDRDDLSSEVIEDQSNCIQSERNPNGDVTIILNPERDCAHLNYSQSLKWTQWLTTCIRSFYNSGMIRIPNNCKGSDILLALEYFGIIYSPDQLSYDSFGVYLRVKLWSEYFTHRVVLGEWVTNALMKSPSKHSHYFITSPTTPKTEDTIFVGSTRGQIFDGALTLDPEKYSGLPSCAVVHDFFHNQDQSHVSRSSTKEKSLDELMREDFSAYLQTSLPGTSISFIVRDDVAVTDKPTMVQRAVLHIDLLSAVPQMESERESIEISSSFPPPKAQSSNKRSKNGSQSGSKPRSYVTVSSDRIRIPLHGSRLKDGKNSRYLDFNTPSLLPIRSFGDGDQIDVMSGLTNPWREDEMPLIMEATGENLDHSKIMSTNNHENSASALDAKVTERALINSQLTQQVLTQKDSTTVANATNKIASLEAKVDSDENPSKDTNQVSTCDSQHLHCLNSTNNTCCDGKANAAISGFVSSPSKCNALDFTLDSLSATFTFILNAIPDPEKKSQRGLQPIVEVQPHVEVDRNIAPGHKNTKSEETTWRSEVVPFDQYIYNDPVPDKNDEYLSLARAASKAKPRMMATKVMAPSVTVPKVAAPKMPQKVVHTKITPEAETSKKNIRMMNSTRSEPTRTNKHPYTYNSRSKIVRITSASAVSSTSKLLKGETCLPVARAVPVHNISSPLKNQSISRDNRQRRKDPLKTVSYPTGFLEIQNDLNGVAPRKMCVPDIFSRKRKTQKGYLHS